MRWRFVEVVTATPGVLVRDAQRHRPLGTTAMFVALAVTWGASFLFIAVGLEGLTPEQVVWGRLVLGALALSLICAVTRSPLPRDPRLWVHLFVVALLLCVLPFSLFAWAQQHVSSGVASILNATTPLMTMVVGLAVLPQERPTRARVGGLLLGFAGVLVVLGVGDGTAGGERLGELACLGATASYGLAFVYLRRFVAGRGLPALTTATAQVLLGAAVMLLATPLIARPAPVLSGRVVGAVVLLGVVGTGLAYVWNTAIVNRWGATNASTVTYLTPLVGVVLGVLVLGEHASWNLPLGALVVIAGVVVAQGRLHGLQQQIRARRAPFKEDYSI
jgi:drug/metabolite transporter (DMT)-like permease